MENEKYSARSRRNERPRIILGPIRLSPLKTQSKTIDMDVNDTCIFHIVPKRRSGNLMKIISVKIRIKFSCNLEELWSIYPNNIAYNLKLIHLWVCELNSVTTIAHGRNRGTKENTIPLIPHTMVVILWKLWFTEKSSVQKKVSWNRSEDKSSRWSKYKQLIAE